MLRRSTPHRGMNRGTSMTPLSDCGTSSRPPRVHGNCVTSPNGGVVAFAVGHLERNGHEDHFFLQELCVRPERQRQGHGAALLQDLGTRMPDVRHWYLLTAREGEA